MDNNTSTATYTIIFNPSSLSLSSSGVCVAMVLVSTLVAIYYNVIIAHGLYYMFASFKSPLPWSDCFYWSNSNCSLTPRVSNWSVPVLTANMTLWENGTCPEGNISIPVHSPSEQYWDLVALQRSSSLDETGPVVWHLALCLLLGWLLIAAALYKGIKSSGKVVYFTATFPYVVLLILLIRGVTLEGARDGIELHIGSQSNLAKLCEAEVWRDAAIQMFYSLSIAWGGVTALSFLKQWFHCVSLTVCTSVFAGFAILSILGHMAHVYGKPVSEVCVCVGFGLAFIAYPDALSKLSISPLWSILFFFMLLTLGLDSQFAGSHLHLPTGVIYWLIGVFYIYGGNRFIKDIEMMIGMRSSLFWLWWRACWFFISPAIIIMILVWSLLTFSTVQYPAWGVALGWCMIAFCLIWIPLLAVWKILTSQGNPWQVGVVGRDLLRHRLPPSF
uniref:Solute carrier family 6 member 14 n=1 Tax=Oncorhynchus kisutch TaxID=8019 RepID=A0A8C7MWZ9_ONCKI